MSQQAPALVLGPNQDLRWNSVGQTDALFNELRANASTQPHQKSSSIGTIISDQATQDAEANS